MEKHDKALISYNNPNQGWCGPDRCTISHHLRVLIGTDVPATPLFLEPGLPGGMSQADAGSG